MVSQHGHWSDHTCWLARPKDFVSQNFGQASWMVGTCECSKRSWFPGDPGRQTHHCCRWSAQAETSAAHYKEVVQLQKGEFPFQHWACNCAILTATAKVFLHWHAAQGKERCSCACYRRHAAWWWSSWWNHESCCGRCRYNLLPPPSCRRQSELQWMSSHLKAWLHEPLLQMAIVCLSQSHRELEVKLQDPWELQLWTI